MRAEREIVRHRGSVAALAVHDDGSIVLVQQYRYAVEQPLWELPAGRLDAGETPQQGAGRELEEEVGLHATRLDLMADFYTTPGFCDERMFLFRGTGLETVPPRARFSHDRHTLVGAGGNVTLGNWLLKGEAAWIDGVRFNNGDETDRIDAMAGVEYYGFEDVSIALDVVNRHNCRVLQTGDRAGFLHEP